MKNLILAFNISRFVKSNAIVIANKDSTIGIGSGQPSRLDSCEIAINKMNKFYKEKKGDKVTFDNNGRTESGVVHKVKRKYIEVDILDGAMRYNVPATMLEMVA